MESLQTLAARAWAQFSMQQEKSIPELAEAAVAERRAGLLAQRDELDRQRNEIQRSLEDLETEKRADIQQREKDLKEQIQATMDVYEPVNPDRYCSKCKRVDHERLENQCSVDGCDFYKICPRCEIYDHIPNFYESCQFYNFSNDDPEDKLCWEQEQCRERIDKETNEEEFKFPPTETGYLKCWICQDRFCVDHFANHYKPCRFQASQHCGFSPPTKDDSRSFYAESNDGRYALCVPGHCGQKLEHIEDENECWQSGCDTICCWECVTICDEDGIKRRYERCGYPRCKLHNECDGACKHY